MELDLLLHQLTNPSLSRDERARLRCEIAKNYEEAGDYKSAREALGALWPSFNERPNTEGLDQGTAADVLLRAGVLTGWIGSAKQITDAQERAKNLISESVRTFEALQDRVKVAEALIDLAYCYWREGAFDEARMILKDALSRLTDQDGHLKSIALIRSAIVEKEATRYNDALRLLTEATPLVEQSSDHALKGKFHNELATVFENLSRAEKREDYRDRAFVEYEAASYHFEQAGHTRYHACVENNLGFLFYTVSKFSEAHEHLSRARRLLARIKDSLHIAQVDETRARVLLAERRNDEAEKIARAAVETLEKGGQQHLLAEALTTHGTALARAGKSQQARLTLNHAILAAEQSGDLEGAGQAALTVLEELGALFSPNDLTVLYERAAELLSASNHPGILVRLKACSLLLVQAVKPNLKPTVETERSREFRPPSNWHNFHFWTELRRYEAYLIERAMRDAGGIVTRAAELLGFKHHQSLNALLKGRHKDLLHLRSRPVEPRKRSAFRVSRPRNISECRRPKESRPITILHVEDNHLVAGAVKETLELEGWKVETCSEGTSALNKLAGGTHYDLLIFDYDLPGATGVELTEYARHLPHLRQTPIIMFSASPYEAEARRAGADIFLKKPEDMYTLIGAVKRLLESKTKGH